MAKQRWQWSTRLAWIMRGSSRLKRGKSVSEFIPAQIWFKSNWFAIFPTNCSNVSMFFLYFLLVCHQRPHAIEGDLSLAGNLFFLIFFLSALGSLLVNHWNQFLVWPWQKDRGAVVYHHLKHYYPPARLGHMQMIYWLELRNCLHRSKDDDVVSGIFHF